MIADLAEPSTRPGADDPRHAIGLKLHRPWSTTLKPLATRSARGCHLGLRDGLLPMCPAGQIRDGGEGGIRTPDRLAPMPHFECGAFNHSATSPGANQEPELPWSGGVLGHDGRGDKAAEGIFRNETAHKKPFFDAADQPGNQVRDGKKWDRHTRIHNGGPVSLHLGEPNGGDGGQSGRPEATADPGPPPRAVQRKAVLNLTSQGYWSDFHRTGPNRLCWDLLPN
jgi:hypothetical protein